jgi:hypothetical protein
MKTKVLIQIEGGIIQAIHANKDMEIVIADFDLIDIGKNPVDTIISPDSIVENMYELFNDSTSNREMEVREQLKRLKI